MEEVCLFKDSMLIYDMNATLRIVILRDIWLYALYDSLDYAAGLEESSTGEVPLQQFCRHNCSVFAAPRKSKRQLTPEIAECCQTQDGCHRPSREAPAQTATGEPGMPNWTWWDLGRIANGVRVILARYDRCVACRWSVVQWHSAQTAACGVECPAARRAASCFCRVDTWTWCCRRTTFPWRLAARIVTWRQCRRHSWRASRPSTVSTTLITQHVAPDLSLPCAYVNVLSFRRCLHHFVLRVRPFRWGLAVSDKCGSQLC